MGSQVYLVYKRILNHLFISNCAYSLITMDKETFLTIQHQVGIPFLQYILNHDQPFESNNSIDEITLTPDQESVLNELQALLEQCGEATARNPLLGKTHLLAREGMLKNSRFNQYREICGGEIVKYESNNEVENFLIQYVINIYPTLIIYSIAETHRAEGVNWEIARDSDFFMDLLKKDEIFSKIILIDNAFGRISYLLENGASTTSLQPFILFDIVYRCFLTCCYRMNYSLEEIIKEVRQTLETLKKIANHEEFEYSTFRGLYGLKIQQMEDLQIDSNVIIRPIDSIYNPALAVRDTSSILSNDGVAGAVIEFIRIARSVPVKKNNFSSSYSDHDTTEYVKHIRMSIVFSSKNVHSPFEETFYDLNLPLLKHLYYKRQIKKGSIGIINTENRQEIASWIETFKNADLSFVSVPLKRLRYAIFERRQPEDSLLDAFIAWEGMFSGRTETTFQVAGSIAKFLEVEPIERKKRFERLKKLYSLRSSLAHGEPEEHPLLRKEDINDLRNEVIDIGIKCFKKLLQSSDLLKLNPQERVNYLLVFL
jgi:hypothetical protein